MKPKKLFHCLLLATITLLAVVTVSCACNETKLASNENKLVSAAVSEAKSECPMSVNKLGNCTAVTYDAKREKVVCHFTVDTRNMLWFERASKRPDLVLRITVVGFIDYGIENPVLTKLFETLIKCQTNLEFAYQSPSGKDILTVPLTYKKLKELRDNLRSESKFCVESLDILVEINNAASPIEMDDGFWLKNMVNGKENLKIVYELDEVNHDFDGFWRSEISMKEEYATEILPSDENRGLLEMLIMTGKGLEVTYKSNRGTQSVHLVYTAEELKKIKELWL